VVVTPAALPPSQGRIVLAGRIYFPQYAAFTVATRPLFPSTEGRRRLGPNGERL
jgi:hypothetical protein